MPKALKILYVGVGEGGGRIAAVAKGNACAINSNKGDLDGLDLAPTEKLLLDTGGTGKDPAYIQKEMKENGIMRKKLENFVEENISGQGEVYDWAMVTVGGGGGTGSGLAFLTIQEILKLGIPVGVIYTLPEEENDSVVHSNAIKTYQQIYNTYGIDGTVSPLILIDNEMMRKRYPASLSDLYVKINENIISTVEAFNEFATKTSTIESTIDKQELMKLFSLGGCCTMGHLEISDFKNFDPQEIEQKIKNSFFVKEFNFKSAKGIGIIITAPQKLLQDKSVTAYASISLAKINEIVGGGTRSFRGAYVSPTGNNLDIWIIINGMLFPKDRIDYIWNKTKEGHTETLKKMQRFDEMGYDLDGVDIAPSTNIEKVRKRMSEMRNPAPPTKVEPTEDVDSDVEEDLVSCDNCLSDRFGRALNKYNGKGDIPFQEGESCPKCFGTGMMPKRGKK